MRQMPWWRYPQSRQLLCRQNGSPLGRRICLRADRGSLFALLPLPPALTLGAHPAAVFDAGTVVHGKAGAAVVRRICIEGVDDGRVPADLANKALGSAQIAL